MRSEGMESVVSDNPGSLNVKGRRQAVATVRYKNKGRLSICLKMA